MAAWVVGVLTAWVLFSVLLGVLVGRGVHVADRRARRATVLTTADLPAGFTPEPVPGRG